MIDRDDRQGSNHIFTNNLSLLFRYLEFQAAGNTG